MTAQNAAPSQGDDSTSRVKESKPDCLGHRAHRQLIGYLGLLLPMILLGLAGLRPTPGLPNWEILNSVSSYYYTGAVAAFVGILFALSLFLFTYGGYRGYLADRVFGILGGLCALGVGLFPTTAPGSLAEPPWWSPMTRTVHYVSAVCLFGVFIVFSLWLFRKTDVPVGEDPGSGKRQRNRVYLWCGLVMVASVFWAASSLFTGADIFWPEVIALWAFAISWLVKGYAHRPVVRRVHRVLGRG